jgi:DNA adenine methylase
MAKKKSVILWVGGKGKVLKKILPLIPYDKIYVEPFGGGASVLLARKPSPVEVYNDIDGGLYDFFSVISDEKMFEKFRRRVEALPLSRRMFDECRENWRSEPNRIERVVKWFIVVRQSFGGNIGNH